MGEPKRRKRVPVACDDCGADLGAHLTGELVVCSCGFVNCAGSTTPTPK